MNPRKITRDASPQGMPRFSEAWSAKSFPLIAAMCLALLAAPASAAVTLTAPTLAAKSGEQVDVPIAASGAKGMSSLQLRLSYDPKVLEPITSDSDPDAAFVKGSILPSNAIVKVFTDTPGRLPIVFVGGADPQAKKVHAVESDGTLVTIRFKVIGPGGSSSPLTLEKAEAFEATDMDMAVTTKAGQITVPGDLPWLWIGVGIAMVLLLLAALRSATRKRPAA